MMYLNPIVSKLTSDSEVLKQAKTISTDKEMLEFLLKSFSIEKIEEVFTQHYGVRYKKLTVENVDESLINKFDKEGMRKQSVIPYHFDSRRNMWHFAISDLIDRNTRKTIVQTCRRNGQDATFTFEFKHEIEHLYQQLEVINIKPKAKREKIESKSITSQQDSGDFNAGEWVDIVIGKGIEIGASDIHIEKLEDAMQIRYRVDGIMTEREITYLSESVVSNIYVRLKIISDMDIVEKRKPQDGRINDYEHGEEVYDLRVSSVSTIFGEKFVMRLFNKTDSIPNFEELGFSKNDENKVKKMMQESSGIIYLAGATGSGKTTTLYTMIEEMDKDALNIYTIENPVEKTLDNINQIQIDEAGGVTYPSTLKALLRQDPDVIVVGEIRDPETAELSIRASLTGHLVMTTIHANSAMDSLGRLIDMGMENYLVGASSIGFLSQKLSRKLCPHCKQKIEHLKEHEEKAIKEIDSNFNYEENKKVGKYIYETTGCDMCIDGHKGRVALVESVVVDDKLRSLISSKADSADIIEYVRLNKDNKSLKEDGLAKLTDGIIGISEFMGQV